MSYKHLTSEERSVIDHFLRLGLSRREIACCLNRDHTTISRELRRNRSAGGYCHQRAQELAEHRGSLPRHYRCQHLEPLVAYVGDKLSVDWAPEQIAGRIRLDHPHDERMRISTETIYRWAYIEACQGGSLYQCLRRRHRRRRPQTRYGKRRRFLPGRVGIAERPEIVASRARFGDWEGDLVAGAVGKGALATCNERKSRYLLAAKVADKAAVSFNAAISGEMAAVPAALRCTLTLDNGTEMARFKDLEEATGLSIYFADPYAPWQRGANENVNGLLRQYFPKGCDFREISDEAIAGAVERLNHRPRKCLGYQTPHEVFTQALNGALAN